MEHQIKVLYLEEQINERICELAKQISEDYAGKELHLVVILKGSVFFACELAKRITVPVTMDFMAVTSDRDGMVSAGEITVKKELDEEIEGRHVLIVEDLLDSGSTLFHLKHLLEGRSPASLKMVTLLDKPDCRTADIRTDYCGFTIPNEFVVGYGVDYEQQYRNLPYVGILNVV